MTKLHWHAVSAVALATLSLAGCNKASNSPPGAVDSAGASSVAPEDGVPLATSSDSTIADAVPGTDAATYLAKAGAGDLFEIASSRAILKTTQNPQIKSFAQMMVKDHESSTKLLTKTARGAGLNVPPAKLRPDQQQTLDAIRAAKGEDADKTYLGAQRDGHAAALMLHKTYAANGNNAALRADAAQIVPVVQHHIEMLDRIGHSVDQHRPLQGGA